MVLALAGSAAACATKPPPASGPRAGLTPTEQYAVKVTSAPDQILLAPHAEGLSAAQSAAVAALVDRWRDAGGGPIVIQAPDHGGGQAFHAANAVQAELAALGVHEDRVSLVGYESGDRQGAPIVVGFDRYKAEGPVCGKVWGSFTSTAENRPNSNFGCAMTANIAAIIANPADLAGPRPMDPADAARRETVLGKYRAGSVTSASSDEQAKGTISNAVP
jgi:pilus assembly protein CpaD